MCPSIFKGGRFCIAPNCTTSKAIRNSGIELWRTLDLTVRPPFPSCVPSVSQNLEGIKQLVTHALALFVYSKPIYIFVSRLGSQNSFLRPWLPIC